ncbi:uncharacterized protein PODANS_7_750 [Podospora anserina S mat+]|uniref:Podospora anserina S mat+ genomic DNA chromosome 7, supercontig 3 n=1 Tax=Podospora anserina (strain S / ATCC MYA-4624 / DSM 980 / FGSC 10383) TaxID=515849 RepID=B2AP17_PODAN|nr:uncharacterized protein PODANS_7_750 [Podospora anserina S mat+]CAP65722.1 unnamed protein product [Podospora anserina S mat+]CDP32782.1 Putative protein of unknown function [Podospora anserina S mat+]
MQSRVTLDHCFGGCQAKSETSHDFSRSPPSSSTLSSQYSISFYTDLLNNNHVQMPLQQNTFVVVPNPVTFQQALAVDGPESKPPMTTKQAQKAYREANRLPKMTKAERLRRERAERERERKEEEKLKASKRAKVLRDRKKERDLELVEERRRQGLPLVRVRPSQATLSTFFKGNGVSRKRDSDAYQADRPAMMEVENKENLTPVGSPSESASIKRQRLGETQSQQDFLQRDEPAAAFLHPSNSPEELLEALIDDFPTASQAARELEEPLVETTEPSPVRRGPPAFMKSSPLHRSVLKQALASSQRNLAPPLDALPDPVVDDDTGYVRPITSQDLVFSSQEVWDPEFEDDEPILVQDGQKQPDVVSDPINDSSPRVPTGRVSLPNRAMADQISSEPIGEPSARVERQTGDTLDGFTYSQFFTSSFNSADEEVGQPQPLNPPPCEPEPPKRSRSPQRLFGSSGNGIAILTARAAELQAEEEAEEERRKQAALERERQRRLQNFMERSREEERLFAQQAAATTELFTSQHGGTRNGDSMAPLSQESDYGADWTLDNIELMDSLVVPVEAGSQDSDEYGPAWTLDNVELLEAQVRGNA